MHFGFCALLYHNSCIAEANLVQATNENYFLVKDAELCILLVYGDLVNLVGSLREYTQ